MYVSIELGQQFLSHCYYTIIIYRYSGERVAQLTCSINLELPKEAIVVGTKGTLKLPAPFWCPTKLETPSVSKQTVYHWYNYYVGPACCQFVGSVSQTSPHHDVWGYMYCGSRLNSACKLSNRMHRFLFVPCSGYLWRVLNW